MSKSFHCPSCKAPLRVTSDHVGKRIRCPKCGHVLHVSSRKRGEQGDHPKPIAGQPFGRQSESVAGPAGQARSGKAKAHASSPPKHEPRWYCQSPEQKVFGPTARSELEQWVAEGRISFDWQIFCDTWKDWRGAREVFPELATEASIVPARGPTPLRAHPTPLIAVAPNPFAFSGVAPTPSPAGTSDPFGVTSMILGIISLVLIAMGFFLCGITWFVAPICAGVGMFCALLGKGNYRVAGLVMNGLVLVPMALFLFSILTGLATLPHAINEVGGGF